MIKKMMKTVFVAVIMISFTLNGMAQKNLAKISESGELRVGMTASQPPFSMKALDGSIIGYDADLAMVLAESMGVELKIVETPFSELINALERGDIDIIMSGMTITMERNMKVAFVGPYILSGNSILTRSPEFSKAEESEQLNANSVRLAVLKGSTSETYVKNEMPDAEITLVENYDDAVNMLVEGKTDIMVADFPICAYEALVHPEKGLITIAQPLTIEPIGVAISPNDPLLLNLVENYMSSLAMIGVLDALEAKWFESGDWLNMVKE
jgi:ABC-type amino acid transport substrate-binding protein